MDIFVATGLAIGLPWLYRVRHSPTSLSAAGQSLLLLAHTLVVLRTLLLHPPPNLFSALSLPLNTSTDSIRARLLSQATATDLGPELDGLLKRLASFDIRALYPRFGHNVLATCTYCHTFDDFALYALPRPLLSYIREIAFIGLTTTPPSHAASLRTSAVAALVLMGISEAYFLATVPIKIPPRGSNEHVTMWHDTLLTLRHTIFLLLPVLLHVLPYFRSRIPFILPSTDLKSTSNPNAAPPASLLAHAHQSLAHLLPTLHLLKYTHAASMRLPTLRASAGEWWAEEARVGAWIRADAGADDGGGAVGRENTGSRTTTANGGAGVRSTARSLGLGFDVGRLAGGNAVGGGHNEEEGKLRTSAKIAFGALAADGLRLSEHWRVHTID